MACTTHWFLGFFLFYHSSLQHITFPWYSSLLSLCPCHSAHHRPLSCLPAPQPRRGTSLNFQSLFGLQILQPWTTGWQLFAFNTQLSSWNSGKRYSFYLGPASFLYKDKEQGNKNHLDVVSSFILVADGNLFTHVYNNPKPFPLPNRYTCDNISKKSHIAHCKRPWSLHCEDNPRYSSHQMSPLAQRQGKD